MNDNRKKINGIWYAIAAFGLWGILPLYWKVLNRVPAAEILAHRILWSFVFISLVLSVNGRWPELRKVAAVPRLMMYMAASAVLISGNWFLYIWAVNSNHIVEASLGYYINPLISIFLGMVFLKEKMNFWQKVSLFLACAGVAIITVKHGSVPWIALSLAGSFGLYGLVKKLANVDSNIGLTLETMVVAPFALVYIVMKQAAGTGSLTHGSLVITLMLIFAGVVTAMPLLWFAQAARSVPLSTIGFAQYLSPTFTLILGVFVFKEPFTRAHLVSFAFIWSALILYSLSRTGVLKSIQPRFVQDKEYHEKSW